MLECHKSINASSQTFTFKDEQGSFFSQLQWTYKPVIAGNVLRRHLTVGTLVFTELLLFCGSELYVVGFL